MIVRIIAQIEVEIEDDVELYEAEVDRIERLLEMIESEEVNSEAKILCHQFIKE